MNSDAKGENAMSGDQPQGRPGRPAQRATLHISVRDHRGGRSLEVEVLKRAREAKVAGATVFEGHQGFGRSGAVHREHLLSDDRPLAVVIVDRPERIDAFLQAARPLLEGVTVTIEDVEILEL